MIRLPFYLALAVITVLAFMPNYRSLPEIVSLSDLLNHFAAFFTLYLLHRLAYRRVSPLKRATLLMFYGLFLEAVQSFLPTRSATLEDLLVDASAIAAAVLFQRLFLPEKPLAA